MMVSKTQTTYLNLSEVDILLNCDDEKLLQAMKLGLRKGMKLAKILENVQIGRRTLQHRLSKYSKKVLGKKTTFESLRFTCRMNLYNKGYTEEYVKEFLGGS